jgi:ribosomal protein L37AE/L43A
LKPWAIECKECGECAVREKEKGLWECLACGRMFNKKPVQLPIEIRKDWKKK